MDVKEAAGVAKAYVGNLFSDESIVNLGLEEVRYDEREGQWRITVGFTRPWQRPPASPLEQAIGARLPHIRSRETPPAFGRTFKVVTVSDDTGKVVSVTDRGTLD